MHEELERRTGPDGEELVLGREESGALVIRSGGAPYLSSAARRSERELVNFALAPLRDRTDCAVLLGGIGMGYALAALLSDPRVARVDVVERNPALVEWNRTHLAALHDKPPLADPRVHVHEMDFEAYLSGLRDGKVPAPQLEHGGFFLSVVLDLDNGVEALSRAENGALYTEEGMARLEDALRPGGVLALWSERREPGLMQLMRVRFQNVAEIIVPVDLPDQSLDYLYRCRRSALQPGVAVPAQTSPQNGHSKAN